MNGCLIERLNVTGKWYSLRVKHDINKLIDTFIRSDIESMPPESPSFEQILKVCRVTDVVLYEIYGGVF